MNQYRRIAETCERILKAIDKRKPDKSLVDAVAKLDPESLAVAYHQGGYSGDVLKDAADAIATGNVFTMIHLESQVRGVGNVARRLAVGSDTGMSPDDMQRIADIVHAKIGNRDKRLVDRETLADLLSLSTGTVDKLVKADEIPVIRVGKAVRFDLEEVVEALRGKSQ